MMRSHTWTLLVAVLAGPSLVAAGEPTEAKPLPWASDPAEARVGGLTVTADKQLFSARSATLHSMQFKVDNPTDKAITLEVKAVELLSARPAPRPWMPDDPKDRQPKVETRPLRSWWVEVDGLTKLIRKDGRLPALVEIPAGKELRLFVGCCEDELHLNRVYWRRGTFQVGGQALVVTGPITEIRFIGGSIEGQLKDPPKPAKQAPPAK